MRLQTSFHTKKPSTSHILSLPATDLPHCLHCPACSFAMYLGDGQGITFGFIGFCTGTYDGNMVVKRYCERCAHKGRGREGLKGTGPGGRKAAQHG